MQSDISDNQMLSFATLEHWLIMVPREMIRETEVFIRMVMDSARKMGMRMAEPIVHNMKDDRQSTYVNDLAEVVSTTKPQLIVCMVTNNRGDRYGSIKKACCVDRASKFL
jgi:hypothetical protein